METTSAPSRLSSKHVSSTQSSHPVQHKIVAYLERHGASRVATISNGLGISRDSAQYHLKKLEVVTVVRSNIPLDSRARRTPYYSLNTR